MNKTAKKILVHMMYPVLVVGALFAVWAIVAASVNNYYILPTLGDTFRAFGNSFVTAEFWVGIGGTLGRTLAAFLISFLFALMLALLSTLYKTARRIFAPLIAILRAIPTLAVVLILAVWMSPQIIPVVVTLLVAFPTLYSGILASFDGVDRSLIEMSRSYGVRTPTMVRKLLIPSVLPVILPVCGSTLSLSIKLMIAAEIMSSTASSIGALMKGANVFFNMGALFALTVVSVVIAVMLEGSFALLTRRVTRWAR